MDPEYPEERIRYMLEDCGAKVIVTTGGKVPENTDIEVIDLYNEEVYSGAPENPERVSGPENLAYCIYTSGTTGKPKGVMIEHHNLVNYCIQSKYNLYGKAIKESCTSLEYFINGLCDPENLLDYIENFILYDRRRTKIIAKNHQFFGVNNAYNAFLRREELKGKLGVFWHTQGSGKSYAMVMLARKIKHKCTGNFTFLIVTDRKDLDTQIYKNFLRTEVINDKDKVQPANSKRLREELQTNKPILFTLIHKFKYEKGKKYPVQSERDDIIVIVDEAHRTQYKDLAENMRTGLPNAQFLAFTGTPLLGSKRLTNAWFGDYVSEYNFADSIKDNATPSSGAWKIIMQRSSK